MDPTDLVPGYGYPPTPEEQEDLLIIARELLRAVPTFLPEWRLWAEEKLADFMVVLHLIHGRRSMSPIRPVRSSDSGGRRFSLRSCAACAVPSDGVYGFPRSLAHTIEPRAPIGKLGFTEG